MQIGIYQNNPQFGEVDYNINQAIEALYGIEADLIVLPELFNTGYQFITRNEADALAEDIPSGKTCKALLDVARSKGMFLVLCHPANLVLPQCQQAMVTRSLENGVFSATANRIGIESRGGKKPLVFTGSSQILDSRGSILTRLGKKETGLSVVQIDPKQANDKKITPMNDRFLDRRPDLYGTLLKSPEGETIKITS